TSAEYGAANILPPIGLVIGSLLSSWLVKKYPPFLLIRWGIFVATIGALLMLIATLQHLSVLFSLFLPVIIIYAGSCFIVANSSTIAMSHVIDKSHGSAVMSFLNMGTATVVVLSLGFFSVQGLFLPLTYLILCGAMTLISLSRR